MADNLCGPSNPTKGLVNHINRNNSLQQDRVVGASPSPTNNSFRSVTQAQAGAASQNAAFASFSAGNAVPGSIVSHPLGRHLTPTASMGPPYRVAFPRNNDRTETITEDQIRNNSLPGVATWVTDFERMQLNNAEWGRMQQENPQQATMGGIQAGPSRVVDPSAMHLPLAPHLNMCFPPVQGQVQAHFGPQYSHYPQDVTLASTSEEALDAAFAAYDDDFQAEMDQWMGAHGRPAERQERVNEEMMTDMFYEQKYNRMDHNPDWMPQNGPEAIQQRNLRDDYDLRQAALGILNVLGPNQDEKFQNSSFVNLMRRICTREVVLEGDGLVDAATGTAVNTSDKPEGPANEAQVEIDGSGKGKAKAEEIEGKGKAKAEEYMPEGQTAA